MEEWGHELNLGRSGGEVILEDDLTLVEAALPRCALLAGDAVPAERGGYVDKLTPWHRISSYSHCMRFMVPSAFLMGLAMNPKG